MTGRPIRLDRPDPVRRRRFAAPHRRRHLLLRLLRPFSMALGIVGLPAFALAWMLTSPRFAVAEMSVVGNLRVSDDWVDQALGGLRGRHLLWIQLPEVERRIGAHPWIAEVALHRDLPDRLTIKIRERRPAALLRRDGELVYVERDGRVIDRFDPLDHPADLLLVSSASEADPRVEEALELAEAWRRIQPQWAAGLSEIETLSDRDFRVFTAALPFPVVVSPESLDPGLGRLSLVLPELRRRYAAIEGVDLRFTNRIVVQPAALPPNQEG